MDNISHVFQVLQKQRNPVLSVKDVPVYLDFCDKIVGYLRRGSSSGKKQKKQKKTRDCYLLLLIQEKPLRVGSL